MSKPDKFGETFDRESREGLAESRNRASQGSADENPDDLESSDVLSGGSAGMGKEIKLGLAVIVVLLIVLGVVVVRRLMRPGTDTASGAAEGAGAAAKQSPASKDSQASLLAAKTGKSAAAAPLSGTSGAAVNRGLPDLDGPIVSDDRKGAPTRVHGPQDSSVTRKEPGTGSPGRFAGFDTGDDRLKGRAPSPGGPWGGGSPPARQPGSGLATDEPPKLSWPATDTPVAPSPFGQSGASFGLQAGPRTGENDLRPGMSSLAGAPREILPPTQPIELSPPVGARMPPALGQAGAADDPTGRGGALGATGTGALRRPDGTYVAEANESFWTISQKLYGTGAYYEALLKHNQARYSRADQLRRGDVILAPSAEDLTRLYPDLCPKPAHREALAERAATRGPSAPPPGTRTYVVQSGDTIYDIARSELGSATRWNEVYQLNRETLGKHPEYITPGMKLVLPEDSGSPGVLTRRPGSGYMR
jgi:nucleoid-associated protein YgaU